jgi:hypothetical protein
MAYSKVIGAKYDAKLSTTEIAARVRAEIKAAQKSGALPKCKISIRKDHHKSIVVAVGELGFSVLNFASLRWQAATNQRGYTPAEHPRYSPRAAALLDVLEAMLDAYNYDRSDISSDYFDVNFYAHIRFADDVESEERAAFEEYEAALKASTPAAPVRHLRVVA